MRYKITLSFSGEDFCGWQIQRSEPSVQGTLQSALSVLLKTPIEAVGAGRTDSGVNAVDYIAHFDSPCELDAGTLCCKLNAILPRSIAVSSIERVSDGFHARFDARSRHYEYHIHRCKDPFAGRYSLQCSYPVLDMTAMNRAASYLLGKHDFSSFEKKGSDNRTSVCTVTRAEWVADDSTHWTFHICADRFLRNMVRSIVGTLIETGRGKRSPEDIPALLESGNRSLAGESVPGGPLFLCGIEY